MQYPSREIDVCPLHRLLGKEVMLPELDSTLQILGQYFLPMLNLILEILHHEPDILGGGSQSLRHSPMTSTHIYNDRTWQI